MLVAYFVYALIGRLFIFFVQAFPLDHLPIIGKVFSEGTSLYKLINCDLCLGFWIYLFLSFFVSNFIMMFPILDNIILAAITSFLGHLIAIGWKTKFSTIVVN